MIAVAPPIGVAQVPGGYRVSLPPRLALVLSLRASFRRVRAAAEPWTYVVPGPAARLGEWLAEVELQALGERRRRAWCASEVEWSGTAPPSAPAGPAPEPIVVRLPRKRTARAVMELLARMAAGEILIIEAANYVFHPSGRRAPAGAARRAIEQRLIVPSCDGLFGPEWSQSWRAPTQEETDAAAERGREGRPAGGETGQDHRRRPVRGHAPRRPRGPARTRPESPPVGDTSRRSVARGSLTQSTVGEVAR